MKRLLALTVILSVLPLTKTNAQETGQDKLGSWRMFFGNVRLSERISISPEIQYRTYEVGSNFNQLLVRNGFNWHITDKAAVTLGYAYISTDVTFEEPSGEENITEHRLYGQFIIRNSLWKFKSVHRYRFEQRFIDSPTNGNATQYRARYLLRLTYPITETWYVSAYNEIFINLQEPIFGQNRLYGAVGYKWSKDLRSEIGYLKNHFTGINFDRLQLGFWYNLDLREGRDF
ncbi:DUF2490 domain-containing protein [Patiriisocius sp. Uisw_017]|uniref:DUF2490 domain-containing protein n=1 Tax=Patiriisocius sp. Uisw_017 TaxID=3230968 RepID=UPI0039EC68FD